MFNKQKAFHSLFPNAYYFDENHLEGLPNYLEEKKIIDPGEKVIRTEKPGEGNMNFVRRIITEKRSFIFKQSRPWVEKYPQIDAPSMRIEVEARYYQCVSDDPFFLSYSPEILFFDPSNLILLSQDLGQGSDFTDCYNKSKEFRNDHIDDLIKYLSHLHNRNWNARENQFPLNLDLRQLNHEHIFIFPYLPENGFDLDTIQAGLQNLSLSIKKDNSLKERIMDFGKAYLSAGPTLIHGDYYPGSWLRIKNEVKVIDPEFAFFGYAEFDLGVMIAHFLMSGMDMMNIKKILKMYKRRQDLEKELCLGFCGTEDLRRIIGLAQLPLDLSLNEKDKLLDLAQEFINSPCANKLL